MGHPLHELADGSIPARAGEPRHGDKRHRTEGSIPARAGNRDWEQRQDGYGRSIPARAGEPASRSPSQSSESVYPRACGGTRPARRPCPCAQGLSPRVRGNRRDNVAIVVFDGSIPARAGEPGAARPSPYRRGVYPRACGGTAVLALQPDQEMGLSPRVAGNRPLAAAERTPAGSIPARAGTQQPQLFGNQLLSLSPRVRGNPGWSRLDLRRKGSIPARAGNLILIW